MSSISKAVALGCLIGLAGCAQRGGGAGPLSPVESSMIPAVDRGGTTLGRAIRPPAPANPAIYVFQGQPDAYEPITGLANVGGMLYGTTYQGGASNEGALYSVSTAGAETVIHSFPTGSNDGIYPDAPLTAVNGTLYGTTNNGGTNGVGVLFSITPSGSYHILYEFGATSTDASEPDTAMTYVASKNALYGTSYLGGANGEGCIFKISLAGTKPKESVVYSFTGDASSEAKTTPPVFFNGALYLTQGAGGANGHGAILQVTLTGSEKVIYSFSDFPDGAEPAAGLTVVGGALYGTTEQGGVSGCANFAGCGTVFKVTAAGDEKVLYRFKDTPITKIDAAGPQSPLLAIGDTLYGVSAGCSGNGCGAGVLYAVTTTGKESIVHDFVNGNPCPSGSPEAPFGNLVSLNGTLYGTTQVNCGAGYGTVYAVPQ